MKTYIRKSISSLGLCPSCLRWQGVFAFEDCVCSVCYERKQDGGALKRIVVGLATAATLGYGVTEVTSLKQENLQLQERLGNIEQQVQQVPFGGGDVLDNGIRGVGNPKYWSKNKR